MKVLWITNTLFPAVNKALNLPPQVLGGWLYSGAKHLLKLFKDIDLGVASVYQGKELKVMNIDGITYFLIPLSGSMVKYDEKTEVYWKEVSSQFMPDVVHIHGTEYPHGLEYVNACGDEDVVVSVQGLVSIIERYYYSGLSEKELRRNITFRDLIKGDSIINQRKAMQQRGEYEKTLLKKVNHIIGRTSWDESHIWALNPEANYHFCNETLRAEFYKHSWNYENCNKFQIFLSLSSYVIKGLHIVIKALPLILAHFPETKIQIAGNNFIFSKKRILRNGYAKYLANLINENKLEDEISFTGMLSEEKMCEKYLESNVFICPSSIENSSNSIGEAQLLGVPCVASIVGGGSDLITHEETGLLYRFEEVEMLAKSICSVFSDIELAKSISEKGKIVASQRHNGQNNTNKLYSIYQSVCKK